MPRYISLDPENYKNTKVVLLNSVFDNSAQVKIFSQNVEIHHFHTVVLQSGLFAICCLTSKKQTKNTTPKMRTT